MALKFWGAVLALPVGNAQLVALNTGGWIRQRVKGVQITIVSLATLTNLFVLVAVQGLG